ncbi:hypothetical protein BsWGS_25981 [Bradybaena similaris]
MIYKFAILAICAVVSADNGDGPGSIPFVGFYVFLDNTVSLTPGNTVKFSEVITNSGNHYDRDTGVFTAPAHGLYLFHLHATPSEGVWLELMQNKILQGHVGSALQKEYSMGGISVLLRVEEGDSIYVRISKKSHIVDNWRRLYVTFTGYLVGL